MFKLERFVIDNVFRQTWLLLVKDVRIKRKRKNKALHTILDKPQVKLGKLWTI